MTKTCQDSLDELESAQRELKEKSAELENGNNLRVQAERKAEDENAALCRQVEILREQLETAQRQGGEDVNSERVVSALRITLEQTVECNDKLKAEIKQIERARMEREMQLQAETESRQEFVEKQKKLNDHCVEAIESLKKDIAAKTEQISMALSHG